MNKIMVVICTTLGVMIIGSIAYVTLNDTPDAESSTIPQQTTPSQPTTSSTAGAYIPYSEEAVAARAGTRILFFHASWCPQCRALEASIQAGPLPDNVTIFKTDYDSHQSLRQKYGVTIQTTLVRINEQGNLVKKYVAYDEPTLAAITEHLL